MAKQTLLKSYLGTTAAKRDAKAEQATQRISDKIATASRAKQRTVQDKRYQKAAANRSQLAAVAAGQRSLGSQRGTAIAKHPQRLQQLASHRVDNLSFDPSLIAEEEVSPYRRSSSPPTVRPPVQSRASSQLLQRLLNPLFDEERIRKEEATVRQLERNTFAHALRAEKQREDEEDLAMLNEPRIKDDRARAEAVLKNPKRLFRQYPELVKAPLPPTPEEARVEDITQMRSLAGNALMNKQIRLDQAAKATQKQDLVSARKYQAEAAEFDQAHKDLSVIATTKRRMMIAEGIELRDNIKDQPTLDIAILEGRKRGITIDDLESNGGIFDKDMQARIRSNRMISAQQLERLDLAKGVASDEAVFASKQRMDERKKKAAAEHISSVANEREAIPKEPGITSTPVSRLAEQADTKTGPGSIAWAFMSPEERAKERAYALPSGADPTLHELAKRNPKAAFDLWMKETEETRAAAREKPAVLKRTEIEAKAIKAGFDTAYREVAEIKSALFDESGDLKETGLMFKWLPTKARNTEQKMKRTIELVLRARTGAAAPPEEVKSYLAMYMPNVADTDEGAAAKVRALEEFIGAVADEVMPGESADPRSERGAGSSVVDWSDL